MSTLEAKKAYIELVNEIIQRLIDNKSSFKQTVSN